MESARPAIPIAPAKAGTAGLRPASRTPELVASPRRFQWRRRLGGLWGTLALSCGWLCGFEPEPTPAQADTAIPFCSPLVLDLDGDGVRTGERETAFDIDGDGRPDRARDVSAADGILVFDADRDGTPGESGRELLGDRADTDGDGKPDTVSDGFEALAALALEANHRGWISEEALRAGRLDGAELKALEAGFGLRVRLGGLRGSDVSLKEAGVAGLRLSAAPSRRRLDFDGSGNDLAERPGAVFLRNNGDPGAYADVWLKFRSALGTQLTSAAH